MKPRAFHPDQPDAFAFSRENLKWAKAVMARYPDGREASAVIPLLWRAQEQNGGWLSKAAIFHVADMLGMEHVRALEAASFYTMFHLSPVGSVAHIQVCGGLPCRLRGAEKLAGVCRRRIAGEEGTLSPDGAFSWEESECLGACTGGPVVQIGARVFEDLTPEALEEIIEALAAGREPDAGPRDGRHAGASPGGPTTLKDDALYAKGSDAEKLIRAAKRGRKTQKAARTSSGRRGDAG